MTNCAHGQGIKLPTGHIIPDRLAELMHRVSAVRSWGLLRTSAQLSNACRHHQLSAPSADLIAVKQCPVQLSDSASPCMLPDAETSRQSVDRRYCTRQRSAQKRVS